MLVVLGAQASPKTNCYICYLLVLATCHSAPATNTRQQGAWLAYSTNKNRSDKRKCGNDTE